MLLIGCQQALVSAMLQLLQTCHHDHHTQGMKHSLMITTHSGPFLSTDVSVLSTSVQAYNVYTLHVLAYNLVGQCSTSNCRNERSH